VPTKVLQIAIVLSSNILLTPKSVNFASPNYELRSILSGLTSRWTCFRSSCKN